MRAKLVDGTGFAVLDRVPVERYGGAENQAIGWMLAQSARPDRRAEAGRHAPLRRPRLRQGARRWRAPLGDQSGAALPYRRRLAAARPALRRPVLPAAGGGGRQSRCASLVTAHHALRDRRRSCSSASRQPFWWDRQAEHARRGALQPRPGLRGRRRTLVARYYDDYVRKGYALAGERSTRAGAAALEAMREIDRGRGELGRVPARERPVPVPQQPPDRAQPDRVSRRRRQAPPAAPLEPRRGLAGAGRRPDLPMLVTLLGTGCPQVHPHRFGPASLVRPAAGASSSTAARASPSACSAPAARAQRSTPLLLTHLHSDHVVDLYQLIVSSWHQGRDRPQRILGPAGTRAFADATMAVWQSEREQRIAWERRPSTAALELEVIEFEEGVIWDADGLRIFAFEVDHRPVAAGLRLPVRDRGLPGRVLGRHHGVRQSRRLGEGRGPPGPRMLHPPGDGSPGAAGAADRASRTSPPTTRCRPRSARSRTRAGARLLCSITSSRSSSTATPCCARSRADFAGPVVIGEDLLTIDVPRRRRLTRACASRSARAERH